MMAILFGSILPWLLIAVGAWLGYQLVRQNGRVLLRLEGIERQLGTSAAAARRDTGGLPIGSAAPRFELPDLTGVRHKLADFRGKNLLLIFFNPKCGFCMKMAADLAALSTDGSNGLAIPIVVTTGDADENRKFIERFGIRSVVLLQKEMEVASLYSAQGTPMGYRIDAAGRIASELTIGAEALLKLAVAPPRTLASSANDSADVGKGDPSLARSRLNRDGLQAGVEAPDFRLPLLEGGELSLTDFRGERVLLVFSDPECGPCMELAPRLEEFHRQRSNLQVVMVSRRDVEANRAKASQLGLSFPIVLQRQWELSLKYAMFATPIGYLINEQGRIAKGVAIGVEPILALAEESVPESDAVALSHSRNEPTWAT